MASIEVRPFNVTTPANTPASSPLRTALTMPTRAIQRIEILVPPGPRGHLGFRISSGGNPVVPVDNTDWIISNDERISWDLDDLPGSGALELTSYNTGQYDHTLYIRFLVALVEGPAGAPPPPIPPAQLAGNPPPPVPLPPPPAPV